MRHTVTDDELRARAGKLGLYGVLARWDELGETPWLKTVVECEEAERQKRSLMRRIHKARLGAFKSIADFDWTWPKKIDREGIEDLFHLGFIAEAANIVLIGSNGLGKTTIACNLLHRALLAGHTALRVTASEMLNDLATQDSGQARNRRLRRYLSPTVLLLDSC
jgi:DNA replication protein DnaC